MSKRTQRKESAFSAGRQARRLNIPKNKNPYLRRDGLRIIWHAGWKHENNQ